MRLIDKDDLLSDIERTIEESGCVNHEGEIMDCVRYASEVDAVPVVRCRYCVKRHTPDCAMWYKCSVCNGQWSWENNDDFCSYGVRKEETK